MPPLMAEVVFSLRNYVGFHEGGDAVLTETELAAILWENNYLFEGRQDAGIRTLDGQRCKNLTMNVQGVLAICDELPTDNSYGRRSAICERCRTNGGMAKDPFGSNKLIERAGGKLVIGQSGFLVWFGDGVNSNLSALLEVEALVDVLRRLRRTKEESSSHFDCVSVFSKLMS
jgi:hypothetical protein